MLLRSKYHYFIILLFHYLFALCDQVDCFANFGRVFLAAPSAYLMLMSPRPAISIKIGGALILLLSYYWAFTMIVILVKRFFRSEKKQSPATKASKAE